MPRLYKRLRYLSLLFSVGFILGFMPAVLSGWQTKAQVVALSPMSNQNVIFTATGLVTKAMESYQAGRYTEAKDHVGQTASERPTFCWYV